MSFSDRNPTAASADRSRWLESPRWYLWDGGFLALGKYEGVVPLHAHHAIQIVMALEGRVATKGADGDWRESRGVIVRHDAQHTFDAKGADGAMIFVDPESSEGVWLRTMLAEDITMIPDARTDPCVAALRAFCEQPFESPEIRELIRGCVLSLCGGAPPTRRADPRVTKVLDAIRGSEDLKVSLEDAAKMTFLSPSRFAHLFKQQVGLPFRRYLLWRKLARALLAIGRERTIADAAHAAGFADAAHLTRTFHQMFGIPPSVLMRGEFFQIPSPFEEARHD